MFNNYELSQPDQKEAEAKPEVDWSFHACREQGVDLRLFADALKKYVAASDNDPFLENSCAADGAIWNFVRDVARFRDLSPFPGLRDRYLPLMGDWSQMGLRLPITDTGLAYVESRNQTAYVPWLPNTLKEIFIGDDYATEPMDFDSEATKKLKALIDQLSDLEVGPHTKWLNIFKRTYNLAKPKTLAATLLWWSQGTKDQGREILASIENSEDWLIADESGHGTTLDSNPTLNSLLFHYDETGELHIPNPGMLEQALNTLKDEIPPKETSFQHGHRDDLGKMTTVIEWNAPAKTNSQLIYLRRIINACRWLVEHKACQLGDVSETLRQAQQLTLMLIEYYDNQGNPYKFHQSLRENYLGLVTGNEAVDSRQVPFCVLDYLDAFLMAAQAPQAFYQFKNQVPELSLEKYASAHPMFGQLGEITIAPIQHYFLLLVLLAKIPQQQRLDYQPLITELLNAAEQAATTAIQAKAIYEPLLYTSSTNPVDLDASKVITWEHIFHGSSPNHQKSDEPPFLQKLFWPQLGVQLQVEPGTKIHSHSAVDFGISADQVVLPEKQLDELPHRHYSLISKAMVQGFGDYAYGHINSLTHIENREPEPTDSLPDIAEDDLTVPVEQPAEPEALPTLYTELPDFSLATRMGTEGEAMVERLIITDQKEVGVAANIRLATLIETILGQTSENKSPKLVDVLLKLSQARVARLALSQAGTHEEAQSLLADLKTSEPDLAQLDETNLLLLALGANGISPKDLLAELTLSNLDTAGEVLTYEAALVVESLQAKHLKFLGFELPGQPQPLFKRRAKLRALKAEFRQANPEGDYRHDPKYQRELLAAVTELIKVLIQNKSYELSMDSPLLAILTAKKTGQLKARCSVDGDLVTALVKFLDPEADTSFSETYGPEGAAALETWLTAWLSASKNGSGEASHAFCLTALPQTNLGKSTNNLIKADATDGSTQLIQADKHTAIPGITAALQAGEAELLTLPDLIRTQIKAVLHCRGRGSHFVSGLALEQNMPMVSLEADPDNIQTLLTVAYDESLPQAERWQALLHALDVEPRYLARGSKTEHTVGNTGNRLIETYFLAQKHQALALCLFCANILATAQFFPPEMTALGKELHQQTIHHLALRNENEQTVLLQECQHLLLPADLALIKITREKYQAEAAALRAQLQAASRPASEIEATLASAVQTQLTTLTDETAATADTVANLAFQLRITDSRERAEEALPGDIAKREFEAETEPVIQERLNLAQPTGVTPDELDTLVERLSAAAGQDILRKFLTGPDGELVDSAKQIQVLQFLQLLTATWAVGASKKLLSETQSSSLAMAKHNPGKVLEPCFATLATNAQAIGAAAPPLSATDLGDETKILAQLNQFAARAQLTTGRASFTALLPAIN